MQRTTAKATTRHVIRFLGGSTSCHPHLLYSPKIAFPSGIQPGVISISSTGRIDSIYPSASPSDAKQLSIKLNSPLTTFGKNTAILPGLIDVHAHISELGRDWEGYETATRAAAAGGITTVMGMPLNSLPATVTTDALSREIDAAANSPMMVDVGLWGGAVPSNTSSEEGLEELTCLLNGGVFGLKAFLAPLPPDAGYDTVTSDQLEKTATVCGRSGKPLLVHSELMTQDEQDTLREQAYENDDIGSYDAHVNARPGQWERDAVEVVCRLTDRCHMHVVHLSDATCLDIIKTTKRRLIQTNDKKGGLSIETCPHYLLFDLESLPHGDTRYKCFPPIRDKTNQAQLWQRGLLNDDSLIDMIASDHSPCTPDLRKMMSKDVKGAWGGLSGLQYQLQSTLTATERYLGTKDDDENHLLLLNRMVQWWCHSPAKLIPGLSSLKGRIDVGYQADLCVVDMSHFGPPKNYSEEHHRWKGTSVYADMDLRGRVVGTWVRGVQVYHGETDTFVDEGTTGVGSIMLCERE